LLKTHLSPLIPISKWLKNPMTYKVPIYKTKFDIFTHFLPFLITVGRTTFW